MNNRIVAQWIAPIMLLFPFQTAVAYDWRVPSQAAIDLAQKTIILDGHVDIPYRIAQSGEDIGEATGSGDFDYPRAIKGGLNAPFMSIYVAARFQESGGAKAQADRLIGLVEGIAYQHPDKFEIAKSVADVERITATGKIALPMGMENGAPIEGDLANLDHFYARGIRYITLTHSRINHISDSSYDEERRWDGLSPFGELLVKRMNDLGVMVDISHVSDAAFFDVIKQTRAPVIASHSSARKFTPGFERNMSDEMIKALGKNGGVIMINFGSLFLTQTYSDWRANYNDAYDQYALTNKSEKDDDLEEEFREEFLPSNPVPFADVDDVIDHIDHVKSLIGIDHIGLGSDYDGVGDSLPVGLKDASTMPNLVQGLMDRDYSNEEIIKILSGNAIRVWRAVEDAADPDLEITLPVKIKRKKFLRQK